LARIRCCASARRCWLPAVPGSACVTPKWRVRCDGTVDCGMHARQTRCRLYQVPSTKYTCTTEGSQKGSGLRCILYSLYSWAIPDDGARTIQNSLRLHTSMRIVKRNFGLEVDAGRRLSGRNFLPQIVAAVHGCGAGLGGNFGSGFDPGIVNLRSSIAFLVPLQLHRVSSRLPGQGF
jgi:hypothetical protein